VIFSSFDAVERHLNSFINYEKALPLGGRDWPKLEPVQNAAARLKLPLRLPHCFHIAGTKGKGSCAAYLEAILKRDYNVLTFTSPHLMSVKERVQHNGQLLSDDFWREGFSDSITRLADESEITLTYFEATFIFYLWAAQKLNCNAHVVECGLGGQWDATNILQETQPLLTLVDYDHMEILGHTLTEISTDKGGIIKPRSTVIIGKQPPEALRVYENISVENNACSLIFGRDYAWQVGADNDFDYLESQYNIKKLNLLSDSPHQRDNAAAAICALRQMFPNISADSIRSGLSGCKIPGRQQLLPGDPPVLVDVAHNPVSFRVLAETLRTKYFGKKITAVIGMMKDKDARACLQELKNLTDKILVVELNSPRSMKPDQLKSIAQSLGIGAEIKASREAAFSDLHNSMPELGLVVGSFYLAGDYLLWRQRAGIA
jgi:dihydrofolate synthase / folylpolyglutamate synthase